jgi:hypothetical protein
MSERKSATAEPVDGELERSRVRFESSLDELRGAVGAELGWIPKARTWALPIAVAAAGVVIGMAVRRALPAARPARSPRRLR